MSACCDDGFVLVGTEVVVVVESQGQDIQNEWKPAFLLECGLAHVGKLVRVFSIALDDFIANSHQTRPNAIDLLRWAVVVCLLHGFDEIKIVVRSRHTVDSLDCMKEAKIVDVEVRTVCWLWMNGDIDNKGCNCFGKLIVIVFDVCSCSILLNENSISAVPKFKVR